MWRDLVHENVLVGHQRVLHGILLNPIRLGDEDLDDQITSIRRNVSSNSKRQPTVLRFTRSRV
jgi:hypothetical protein